jgi:hypothetical protein
MRNENTRFEETQAFAPWVYGLLGGTTALPFLLPAGLRGEGALVLGLVYVPVMALTVNLLCMRTRVDADALTVTFGYLFPLYRRHIPRGEIARAESVTYSPLGEYGGWGIRGWGDDAALNARGDRGVRLLLAGGKRLLIGSQRPDELAAVLTGA